MLTEEAKKCFAKNGLVATIDLKNDGQIVIKPKKKTIGDIINDYKEGAKLVFSNGAAVMVILGFFLKQTNGTVQQLYLNYFFQ